MTMSLLKSIPLAAVLAIARKDLLLMKRYPLSLVSRIIDPIGWLVPVYFLGRTFSRGREAVGFAAWSGTGDFMSFLIVGWVVSAYVVSVLWGMSFSLKNEMDSGVLEANWVTPLSPLLLLVGRTLASMTITTVGTSVFGVLAAGLFGISIRGQIFPAICLIIPVIIGLYGIGFVLAGVVLRMREANTLIDFSNFVLELVSGRDFPVAVLPLPLFLFALLLPLTYGYDGIRALLLGTRPLASLPVEAAVVVVFMLAMLGGGSWAFHRFERHCRIHGTLAHH
jgi:ABC-2 type transport system permease protein